MTSHAMLLCEREIDATDARMEAAILEFQAACIQPDSVLQETIRMRMHDLVDIRFDAERRMQSMINEGGGQSDAD